MNHEKNDDVNLVKFEKTFWLVIMKNEFWFIKNLNEMLHEWSRVAIRKTYLKINKKGKPYIFKTFDAVFPFASLLPPLES